MHLGVNMHVAIGLLSDEIFSELSIFLQKGGPVQKLMFQIIKKHHPLLWIYMNINIDSVSDFAHRGLNLVASQDWSL